MIILGIDPGTAIVGWGVVDFTDSRLTPVAYGSIQPQEVDITGRLLSIYKDMNELIRTYHPDAVSVEDLYFATNAKTAISVGQARGVILLTGAMANLPVVSYSPLTVKQTICGDGHADKKQVEKMITLILKLKSTPKPDDVCDALAIAMTHAYKYKLERMSI